VINGLGLFLDWTSFISKISLIIIYVLVSLMSSFILFTFWGFSMHRNCCWLWLAPGASQEPNHYSVFDCCKCRKDIQWNITIITCIL
jgi:hypothetical protein